MKVRARDPHVRQLHRTAPAPCRQGRGPPVAGDNHRRTSIVTSSLAPCRRHATDLTSKNGHHHLLLRRRAGASNPGSRAGSSLFTCARGTTLPLALRRRAGASSLGSRGSSSLAPCRRHADRLIDDPRHLLRGAVPAPGCPPPDLSLTHRVKILETVPFSSRIAGHFEGKSAVPQDRGESLRPARSKFLIAGPSQNTPRRGFAQLPGARHELALEVLIAGPSQNTSPTRIRAVARRTTRARARGSHRRPGPEHFLDEDLAHELERRFRAGANSNSRASTAGPAETNGHYPPKAAVRAHA